MKKVVLVTGSSRGIGKETIIEFAKHDYNVVINYVKDDKSAIELKKYVEENYDVEALCIKADVSSENQVKEMFDIIMRRFNKIDAIVNNAGIALDSVFEEKNKEKFNIILDTNLIGPFLVSKQASKYMKEGSIVNVSSTNALNTYYIYSLDYDASKAALISLTHNLAKYLAPNIRVNAVAPGWTNTDAIKEMDKEQIEKEYKYIYQKRFADPKEIAKVIYFLSSDDASYITNEVIRVDGGSDHE